MQNILEKIYATEASVTNAPNLLQEILKFDENVIDRAMDKDGLFLKQFARKSDIDHPHVREIFNGIMVENSNFAQTVIQLLAITQLAIEQNYWLVVEELKCVGQKLLKDNNVWKLPNIERQYVRLLKNRQEIRLQKTSEQLDLSSVFSKGDTFWSNSPNDFEIYYFKSEQYAKLIDKAVERAEYYKNLGCAVLYEEIVRSIKEFEIGFQQSYYGFHKIKMTEAAVILAKLNGFILRKNLSDNLCISIKIMGKINDFRPMICPLHLTNWESVEPIKKLVDFLEAFPAVNYKPIFDHFIFVISKLTNNTTVGQSILLGEKDGRCYFICFGEDCKILEKVVDYDIPF
jgi:hypothetical protein